MHEQLDYNIENFSPVMDAVTISVFNTDDSIEIKMWREEDQSVRIEIVDCDGNETRIILGEPSVTTKL